MRDDSTHHSPMTVRDGHAHVQALAGLHDLAIAAEQLVNLLEEEGRDVLGPIDSLRLDQARSNAASIAASLGRLG